MICSPFLLHNIEPSVFYNGVGHYTPNSDCGLLSKEIKEWSAVINQWCTLRIMSSFRLNAKVFNYSTSQSGERCKNLYYRLQR